MTKVGIPRSLLYYQYYPMWKAFFDELGVEIVISPPTTQAMLAQGSSRVVADTCLPVKVYLGHVLWLIDKCDTVFIPAVRSVEERVYNCSKFLGLPDMTKAVVPELPHILEIDIDINRGKLELYRQIYRLGRHFSLDPIRIRRAALSAWQAHLDYRAVMSDRKLTVSEVLEKEYEAGGSAGRQITKNQPITESTIAVIGHSYLIYDEFINHRLIHRLEKAGNKVLTPEMINTDDTRSAVVLITGGSYWTYEEEVVGAGGYYLQGEVDGVIGLMAFGCGPDSLMMDMVRRFSTNQGNAPFMCLTLEEHTAEAGIITRLEAFTDMLRRKKKREMEVCV